MNKHFSKFHQNNCRNICTAANSNMANNIVIDFNDNNIDPQSMQKQLDFTERPLNKINPESKRLKVEQINENSQYFIDEMGEDTAGIHGLVSRSFQRNNNIDVKIDHNEALFHMQLTNSLYSLPEHQQQNILIYFTK